MNSAVGRPEVGQWYAHRDKGEIFQVTGIDDGSKSIEIQYFDGDVDEIEEPSWFGMPLERAAAPEDCTGALDEVESDDLGYSETAMSDREWQEPLQPFGATPEAWEDATNPEERDPEGEGVPDETLTLDEPDALDKLA